MSENNLWAVLYVSTAMKDLQPAEVQAYLDLSRNTRSQKDITGLVIMADKNILVVQEGPKNAVKEEFETEKRHPAHHSMIKLYDGPIVGRFFEGLPLAFKTSGKSDYRSMDDFNDPVLEDHFNALLELDDLVAKLLKNFIKNNS